MSVSFTYGTFDSPMRFKFKHTSAQRTETQNIIVKLTDHNGLSGYGEGCPRQYVTGETTESVFEFMSEYGKTIALNATDLNTLQSWIKANSQLIDDNPSAFCAAEMAALDLIARQGQMPIEKLLQLSSPSQEIPYTAVIGDASPIKMRLISAAYRLYGFQEYKVKLSGDLQRDRARLAVLPNSARLRVDANNLWDNSDACINYCRKLPREIWAIEEPVHAFDYGAMQKIATQLGVQIILDESLYTAEHLSHIDRESEQFIANIRVSKCGGIIRSIGLARLCAKGNVDVILGAHVGETSLLTRAAIATRQGLTTQPLANEGAYGKLLLKQDITSLDIKFGNGGTVKPATYNFGTAHGLGIEVNTSDISWIN